MGCALELCCHHGLCIRNTFFNTKPQDKSAWRHARCKHWHQLDLILTRRVNLSSIKITRSYQSAGCNTDYSGVQQCEAPREEEGQSRIDTSEKRGHREVEVCWLVGCLTPQQQASVSWGRICSDNFTCCHTEIEAADPKFYLTQSQYADTGPTSPRADPITLGAWQGSHWSANFLSHWYDSTPKKSRRKRDSNPGSSVLEADALTPKPTRRYRSGGV